MDVKIPIGFMNISAVAAKSFLAEALAALKSV
jgi:hypothetical protein